VSDNEVGRAPTKERRLVGPELIDSETHTLKVEPKETPEEARHRRMITLGTTILLGVLVPPLFLCSLYYAFNGNPDQAKYGQGILSAFLGAIISRVLGKVS